MEHSPSWEANRFAASQVIPRILRNPKFHYRIHKCAPPLPILCQIDPIYASTSHFLKLNINIILPSAPGPSELRLSLMFPHHKPVYNSSSPIRATCPAHLILLNTITRDSEGNALTSVPLVTSTTNVVISLTTHFGSSLSLNISDILISHVFERNRHWIHKKLYGFRSLEWSGTEEN